MVLSLSLSSSLLLSRQGRRNYPSILEHLLLEHAPTTAAAAVVGGNANGGTSSLSSTAPDSHTPSSLTPNHTSAQQQQQQQQQASAIASSNSGTGSGSVFNFSLGSRSPLRAFPSSQPVQQQQQQQEDPSSSSSSSVSLTEHVTLSRLTSLLLESLLHSLEGKAAHSAVTDPCVQALFLLNNAVYVAKNL